MTRFIKTTEEINYIREGGHKLGRLLAELGAMTKAGITTAELEERACAAIAGFGARPAFKNYRPDKHGQPFPTALCISINDAVVHGPALPNRVIKEGDLVSLDIGMEYPYQKGKAGYYTDTAITVGVGKISKDAERLLEGTQESLMAGIALAAPGVTLLELGTAIEDVLKKYKLGVVRELVGHGVGLDVHEEPQIPNYSFPKGEFPDFKLEAGMVIAIEPMATLGAWRIKSAGDGFTYSTNDGSLAAHFEHTVLITETGSEILTAAK